MSLPPPPIKTPAPRWLRVIRKLRPRLGQQWIDWGYGYVPFRLLGLNWFFQRCLGLNGNAPFSVNFRSAVSGGTHIRLGKRVGASLALSGGLYITGDHGLEIGDGTYIAPNVGIVSTNHDIYNRSLYTQDGPVKIGRNCWLGMGSVILPGVTLGDNVTVAAGAVVNKSFPGDVVIGGVPARVLTEVTPETIRAYRHKHGITTLDDLPSV